MDQPQATDGIAAFQQQMAAATPEQRSPLLATALAYGEAGIDLLITTLNNDPVLTVRATAYHLLQQVIFQEEGNANAGQVPSVLKKVQQAIQPNRILKKVQQAIRNGIPLKQGDRLYRVYISAVDYDDEYYTLLDSVQAYEAHDFCYDELLHPVECYIFRQQAEEVATDLHRVILSNGNFAEFNQRHQLQIKPSKYYLCTVVGDLCNFYRNGSQPVCDWCTEHEIDIDLSEYFDEAMLDEGEEWDYWWEAQEEILQTLQDQKNYSLLEEFCNLIEMGRFTFVDEEIVDQEGFLAVAKS